MNKQNTAEKLIEKVAADLRLALAKAKAGKDFHGEWETAQYDLGKLLGELHVAKDYQSNGYPKAEEVEEGLTFSGSD